MTYGGDHIPKSPFSVAVAPTMDLSKISVTGLGESASTHRMETSVFHLCFTRVPPVFHMFAVVFLLSEMTVGRDQDITVKAKGAGGQGKVGAKVTAPSGKPVSSKVGKVVRPHLEACSPRSSGVSL